MSTIQPTEQEIHEIRSQLGTPTWEVARMYPMQGEWSEAAYLEIADRLDERVELNNGVLEFLPMANLLHGLAIEVLMDLLRELRQSKKLPCRRVPASTKVRLWKGKYRDPDVSLIRANAPGAGLKRQPLASELILVIEMLSPRPEDRERDLIIKRAEYAQAGIPEYWIVDPEQETILILTLSGGEYAVHGEFRRGDVAASPQLLDFQFEVSRFFDDVTGQS